MRWYQFQLRKPKRWARRAKPDGSAVPKLKGVQCFRESRWAKAFSILTNASLLLWVGLFAVAVVYFLLGFWNIAPLIGVNWSIDQFVSILMVCKWICFVIAPLIVLNAAQFVIGHRRYTKLAIAHRCHLCPRCGYSLQSRTSDDQPCPECGQRISRREAVRLWARFCR